MEKILAANPNVGPKASPINLGSQQQFGVPTSTGLGTIISNLVTIAILIGALIVIAMIIWGAIEWLTSGGDKERVGNARKRILNAIIGLVLLALAFFIVNIVGQLVGINPLEDFTIPRIFDPIVGTPKSGTDFTQPASQLNPGGGN